MKPKSLVVLVLLSLVVAGTAFFLLQNHAETETPPSAPVARTLSGAEVSALASKAQAGDAEAQTALGRIYLAGQSVKPDVKAAVKWFQSAAAFYACALSRSSSVRPRRSNRTRRWTRTVWPEGMEENHM